MPETIPALPPGFKLDPVPALPPGFKLDPEGGTGVESTPQLKPGERFKQEHPFLYEMWKGSANIGPGIMELPAGAVGAAAEAAGPGIAATGRGIAASVANKLPGKIHPVGQFIAELIPGGGTVLRAVKAFKTTFGTDVENLSNLTQKQLAHKLYEETEGVAPKTAQESVDAIRRLRSAIKGKGTEANVPEGPGTGLRGASAPTRTPIAPPIKTASTTRYTTTADAGQTSSRQIDLGKVAEVQAKTKDRTIGAYLTKKGLKPEDLEKMTEPEYLEHLKEVNAARKAQGLGRFESPRPGPNRRTFEELRADIAKAMKTL